MSTKAKSTVASPTNEASKTSDFIPIIIPAVRPRDNDPWTSSTRGIKERVDAAVATTTQLAKEKLADLCAQVDDALTMADQRLKLFKIDELELTLEVTAKGEVGVKAFGTAEAGGSGTIKLMLKRK